MKLKKAIGRYERSITVEATRVLYGYTLASLLDHCGNIDLTRIDTDRLRGWKISQEQHRSQSSRNKGKKLSVYTLHRHIRVCKQFFRWLVREGHLDHSPAERLEFPRLPRGEPPKAISQADIERMIERAELEAREVDNLASLRNYALIRFLAETGCRVGGLVGLRLADLQESLASLEVTVREKGEKTRTVAFGPKTAAALRAWLVMRPRLKSDAVFTGKRGPLTSSGVYQILAGLAERAEVEGRHNPHSFRHALARRLLQHKADLGTVAEILGHADVGTTHQFYARWSSEELKRRHADFGGVLP
jgi:site-specific recombinase XerD